MPRVGAPEGQTRGAARPLSLSEQRQLPRRSRVIPLSATGARSAEGGSSFTPWWAPSGLPVA